MDLWNQIEVFISLFESTCRGLERGKMWAKIKVVIKHTVVEQRLFGLPVAWDRIFHFASLSRATCSAADSLSRLSWSLGSSHESRNLRVRHIPQTQGCSNLTNQFFCFIFGSCKSRKQMQSHAIKTKCVHGSVSSTGAHVSSGSVAARSVGAWPPQNWHRTFPCVYVDFKHALMLLIITLEF